MSLSGHDTTVFPSSQQLQDTVGWHWFETHHQLRKKQTEENCVSDLYPWSSAREMKRYQSLVESWAADLITQIDKELSEKVLKPDSPAAARLVPNREKDIRLARQIFTLGELAQICPKLIGRKLYLSMQNIVFQKVSIFVMQVGKYVLSGSK